MNKKVVIMLFILIMVTAIILTYIVFRLTYPKGESGFFCKSNYVKDGFLDYDISIENVKFEFLYKNTEE